MKKLIYILVAVFTISIANTSCNNKEKEAAEQKADSLARINEDKDEDIAELEALMQQIQDGFDEISQAENRIRVERAHGESNRSAAIKEDMDFIRETIAAKQQKITELQSMMNALKKSNDADKKKYEALFAEYEKKISDFQALTVGYEQYITDIESQLVAKDNIIAEQKTEIAEKQTTITEQAEELDSRARTISVQDKELNKAYYVFGTKKELKEQAILNDGEVLRQGNFNKNYFTQIDIRTTKTIKLYSKSATMKSAHPAGSYTLEKDANKQYVLRITDPDKFWSTSKYLVILVK